MNDKLHLWEILVPATINGVKIVKHWHKKWDEFVVETTGGVTVLTKAVGQWSSNQGHILDELIPVRIACTVEQIDKIIDFTIKHYKQEAVMAYQVSMNVIVKHQTDVNKSKPQIQKKT